MDSLIFISPFVNKFLAFFQYIFVSERKATQYNLLLLVLGIVVTSSLSVRKCFRHVATRLSDKSLNSFYYLLSDGKISLNIWSTQIIKLALRCIPPAYEEAPILLAVDDTLVEKEGTEFAHRGKLFEHSGYSQPRGKSWASQNKKGRFIYGHCFVTLIMLIPAMRLCAKTCVTSLRPLIPLGSWRYRMELHLVRSELPEQMGQLNLHSA